MTARQRSKRRAPGVAGIRATLQHHEGQLGRLQGDVDALRGEVADLGSSQEKILAALQDLKDTRGPGLKATVNMMLSGGALIGLVASGITLLVTSLVQPQITALDGIAQENRAKLERLHGDRDEELRELRALARKR